MLLMCLIFFFILLIIYQLILAFSNNTEDIYKEGLENNDKFQPYDTNNPANALILAQQNAGNINFLNQRLGDVQNLQQKVQDLSSKYDNLQTQVNDLITAQQEYTSSMAPSEPPQITGAVPE